MLRNLRGLLSSELHDNQPKLYNRAADQWRWLVGGVTFSVTSGGLATVAVESIQAADNASKIFALGTVALTAANLVWTGINIGQLNETGRAFAESQATQSQLSETNLPAHLTVEA